MVSLDDGRNNGIHQLLSVYIYNKYAFQYDVYRPLWWSPLDVSTGWGVVPYPSGWRPPSACWPPSGWRLPLDGEPPAEGTWDQTARQKWHHTSSEKNMGPGSQAVSDIIHTPCEQTNRCKNITFPQLHWWAVIKQGNKNCTRSASALLRLQNMPWWDEYFQFLLWSHVKFSTIVLNVNILMTNKEYFLVDWHNIPFLDMPSISGLEITLKQHYHQIDIQNKNAFQ